MALVGGFVVPHPPLIIPQIGKGQERKIQATIDAYHAAGRMIADLMPDTVVIVTPHSVAYSDYIHISPGGTARGDFGMFGSPQVQISAAYDQEFTSWLERLSEHRGIPAGTDGERDSRLDHGSMIPMYFINKYCQDFKVVRVSISGLPLVTHFRFGGLIAEAAEETGKRVVVVASGDLSHKLIEDGPYGFAEEGPVFDQKVTEAMRAGNLKQLLDLSETFCSAAAECGLRSVVVLAGALEGRTIKPELLSYEGPFGVGYAVAAFSIQCAGQRRDGSSAESGGEDEYVKLARMSLEYYVRNRRLLSRPDWIKDELLTMRAGVFVSLHIGDELRGCIGTIAPTAPCVADEIIRNAVSAGMEDPRFPPVKQEELPYLSYKVDVLGEPEPVQSKEQLDPKRYGVIVSSGYRRGLLLPDLDGVDTVEEQLRIACLKAGISPSEPYQISRFEVVRHT